MSKAAKQSITILIILLIAGLGFAGYTLLEKQKLEQNKADLERELESASAREKQNIFQIKKLNDEVASLNSQKLETQRKLQNAEKKAADLNQQLSQVKEDRDKWKRRIDTVSKERDDLNSKISDFEKSIGRTKREKENEIRALKLQLDDMERKLAESKEGSSDNDSSMTAKKPMINTRETGTFTSARSDTSRHHFRENDVVDEKYWASLLQEKAALEIEVEELQDELSKKSIEVLEIKQSNTSLQLELDKFKHENEEIQREIKHKADLINNISLELARTKNDKKFVADRVDKLNEENNTLRKEMKLLVSKKAALEKSIVKLTQDKNKVERELGGTEIFIQSKIDEIWEIKDSIDRSFKNAQGMVPNSTNEFELPPIHVSAAEGKTMTFDEGAQEPGLQGKVISVNDDNNFVIVDVGEERGVQVGNMLSIYRDSKYIARLEVIQVRKDISAADIKDKWSQIRVGDIVR